jgi:hypothetical protein
LLAKPHKAAKEEGQERRWLETAIVAEGEKTLERKENPRGQRP